MAFVISYQALGEGETRNYQGHLLSKTAKFTSCDVNRAFYFMGYYSLIIFIEQWSSCSGNSRTYLEVVYFTRIKRIQIYSSGTEKKNLKKYHVSLSQNK